MGVFDSFRLDGKVSIVTGAHAWLGFDGASALAEAGSDIIITSRKQERADSAAEKIKKEFGVDALGLTMDQCHYDQVKDMMEKAHAWKGPIDVIINNAGGGSGDSPGHILKRTPDDAIELITTNLIGVLHCCKEAAKYMLEQGHGKIVNIASIAGMIGRDRRMYDRSGMKGQPVDYAAAKAGVIGLTKDLAAMLSPDGVYVNAISPGGFDKGILPEQFTKDFADEAMLGRWGRMGVDLKGAVLFLASSASDYVTGHNLVVDGGFNIFK